MYVHRKFGSKLLIDVMSKLGLCHSYDEVLLYETSSLAVCVPEDRDSFHQFVFDNADFNVNTIDGLNTFHQMGGIQCLTPSTATTFPSFPRLKPLARDSLKVKPKKISIQRWATFENTDIPGNLIKDLNHLRPSYSDGGKTMPTNSTLLWMFASAIRNDVPSWSGFMSELTKFKSYEMSKIKCLPFINLPPSSHDALFSVLKYTENFLMSENVKQSSVFLTFDQPLYSKAHDMLQQLIHTSVEKNGFSKVIVRLGGFHLLMSFMGAIGNIMAGSGLQEVWSIIYAPNVASQLMTGHSYSRTLRAHFLTQLALAKIIFEKCKDQLNSDDLKLLQNSDLSSFSDFDNNSIVVELRNILKQQLDSLCVYGKTARLWVQYFQLVNLIRNFIEAERSGIITTCMPKE